MYYQKGTVTRQAHVDIPEGTFEEEFGRRGFFGRVSHLYRKQRLTGWSHIEGPLRPQALILDHLKGLDRPDYLEGRISFLENSDTRIGFAHVDQSMSYFFRNADGDEVLFVHDGTGRIETDFGPLNVRRGDYIVIPRGTQYRIHPDEALALLIIESAHEVTIPDRGVLGRHALFDEGAITVPTPQPPPEMPGDYVVKVKRSNQISAITYPFYPINTMGWKGDLTVWQLNIADIRPIMSERYHLPPTAHITFLMETAVICTFLPRALETGDPGALRVPFEHTNIDFDEVIFYHDGDFFSREGISPGMVTFHPQGIHHGPHPQAVEGSKGKTRTEEKAVMVDTRFPLELTQEAKDICIADYWKSWMPKKQVEGGVS